MFALSFKGMAKLLDHIGRIKRAFIINPTALQFSYSVSSGVMLFINLISWKLAFWFGQGSSKYQNFENTNVSGFIPYFVFFCVLEHIVPLFGGLKCNVL